jgi:peptidoglycan/LPS O-acetylase OafA/YrhL
VHLGGGPAGATSPAVGGHLSALDGLRGLCLLLVLQRHFNTFWNPRTIGEYFYTVPLHLSITALDIFFALSGFLICGILLDSKGGEGYFRNFYMRRVLRILPIYYLFLILWFMVLPAVWPGDASDFTYPLSTQAWYWTYLTNLMIVLRAPAPIPSRTYHLWSLSIEEQFYFLWPVVCWTALRLRRRASTVGMVALVTASAALLLRFRAVDADWALLRARSGLDTRAFALALGASARVWLPPGRMPAWLASIVAGVGSALFIVAIASVRVYDVRALATWWSAAAVGAALLVAGAASGGLVARVLALPPLTYTGRISYSLYLWHPAVIAAAEPHVRRWNASARHIALGTVSVAVAAVSYRLIEQPFQHRRTRPAVA